MVAKTKHGREQTGKGGLGFLVTLSVFCILISAAYFTAGWVINSWLQDLPVLEDPGSFTYSQKTRVYADDGTTLLAEFYKENREPIAIGQVSPFVLQGTVATEDERFYYHDGVDFQGILRAVWNNLTGDSIEGASTITQQFIRYTYLAEEANDITLKRKLREAALSLDFEKLYSKNEILMMYLNTINYGSGCYGIEVASNYYFQKHASDLNMIEAATLVGIPQTPTNNNPVDNPNNCLSRRNLVLNRMCSKDVITTQECDFSKAEPLVLNLAQKGPENGLYQYPYFTSYVRQLLLEQYTEKQVFEDGLIVHTTINPEMQDKAQFAANAQCERMADDLEVSLTAIDPDNGFIKAMIGGRDFYADQYNLATQSKRQAGSSFKTFTLVSAIEQAINPSQSIDCSSPVTLNGWRVENYGGASYGTRTISGATAISSNTGFARLIQTVTPAAVVKTAHKMGITSDLEEVDSITLGTQGVCTLEMADAYSTLASGGLHRDAIAIQKVTDRSGKVLYEYQDNPQRVLSNEVAYAATKVLRGVFTGGTATAAQLYSGQPAAGKTGTSENWRDSWLCAYTPQLTCAVWIGAREERTMPESIDCSYTWRTFMTQALENEPYQDFPVYSDPPYIYRSLSVPQSNTYSYNYNYNNNYNNNYSYNYNYNYDYSYDYNNDYKPSATEQYTDTYDDDDDDDWSSGYNSQQNSAYTQTDEYGLDSYNPQTAPATDGMYLYDAADSLAGYTAEYVSEYSYSVAPGQVIYQEVVNGVVRLHVSAGPPPQ